MHKAKPTHRRWSILTLLALPLLLLIAVFLSGATPAPRSAAPAAIAANGEVLTAVSVAEVNFTDLAQHAALAPAPPVRVKLFPELEEPAEPVSPTSLESVHPFAPEPTRTFSPQVASPSPSVNYDGLDDIPMVDSSYIIIPPDVNGAVGPTKVMEDLNNNLRIRDKATGVTQLTVGNATFWGPVTTAADRGALTDPRTVYDPYNCCFIMATQTFGLNGSLLVAVSQTSDPAGAWWLYKFNPLGTVGAYQLDYPILGFNKNWATITINRYNAAGTFQNGIALVLNYPQLRVGVGSGTLFSLTVGGATTHFCASPAVTYSATEDTEFVVTHFSSGGATFAVDAITGTPAAPVYNAAAALTVRPGGAWVQPNGNIEPQSAPVAGASICGATPCPVEAADAQVRQTPMYRNGLLWYAQTIRFSATTATAAQWTCVTPSLTPAFVDGGRVGDPTATSTNGGKWYDHTSLCVNAQNDVILGFSEFSSAEHPSAGYAFRYGTDAPGTMRDPFIYKAGDDYYHKTFTTNTGRNRWGDFTTCQVDPCDDLTLWTLQEYAKPRTASANDGTTGSNSSRWATRWAAVAGPALVAGITCPPDTIGTPGGSMTRAMRITNTGTATGTFNYSITDGAGWGGPVSGTTPPLAPSSFFDVFITLNLPSDCNPPSDLVTLSVTPNLGCPTCYQPVTCSWRVFCDVATATLVSRFDAAQADGGVDLSWASDAVGQVEGWNVYRSPSEQGAWARINTDPIPMRSGGQFRLHDGQAGSGTMFYRLAALLPGGGEQAVSTTQLSSSGPAFSFAISGSNPFTRGTRLRYSVPKAVHVQIDVFSISGQRVRTLVNRFDSPGNYSVDFSLREGGHALTAGVYMIRITAGADQKTVRVIGMD